MCINGIFFFLEIGRLDDWTTERLAESGFEAEEIAAGVQRLNAAFGIYSTIDMISKHTAVSEDDLMIEDNLILDVEDTVSSRCCYEVIGTPEYYTTSQPLSSFTHIL